MWSLTADVHHLNHGSFGAVPLAVQEDRMAWLRRWEGATSRFVIEDFAEAVERARREVAGFVGARPEGFAFVRNVSIGVASVLRSVEPWLGPGDEILVTTQTYNAVRQTVEFTAARTGAKVVVAPVPFPVEGPDTVIESILDAVGGRTRLAVIDHVSSSTALVYPITEMVAALEPGIPVLVDGAHGPGQVPVDVETLGASWYTGNLHKWVCAPKGAGFLATRADRVESTYPVVISHGWNTPMFEGQSRYHALFDWLGTDDTTPWLSAPTAIRHVGSMLEGGWPAIMARNHRLVVEGRAVMCDVLGIPEPAPEAMLGSMAAIPLPPGHGEPTPNQLSPLTALLATAGFETLVYPWPTWPEQVIRISAHLYNTLDGYEKLAAVLSELVG
ncbi:MAG: aminotransferase class V-fold PLP-dependent enzyme [Actinobacteria bacterium]|nr:aminotransferase class V-fold PLP-dependent enzyme [Actinomycetota bacterium]